MKRKLLLALSLLSGILSYAQVSSYSFTQSVGSYGPANTGSMVGYVLQDDDVTSVGLPFTFVFNGTSYTSINVCSNGYLSFNSLTGSEYTAISDGGTSEVLAPFSQDLAIATVVIGDFTSGSNVITNVSSTSNISVGDSLIDFNFDFGGYSPTVTAVSGNNITLNLSAQNNNSGAPVVAMNGYIKQQTTGVAPNRICEFEFKNACRYGVFDESLRFKVKLYETTNKIEFVYGSMIPSLDNINSEVGLKGTTGSDFNSRYVASGVSWSNSVPAINLFDDCDFSNLNFPVNGLTYAWSQSVCVTPTLSIAQSNTVICAGQSATITASGASTYSWSTGSATTQIVITPTATTNYTVTGYNATCSSSMVVTQTLTPLPSISVTQSSLVICAGNSATLMASGATSYTWSNGATGSVVIVSPTTNTTYVVTGDNSSCQGNAQITQSVSICTGIENNLAETKLVSLYPNPSSGSFVIKTNSSEANRLVNIYNVLGAKVYTQAAGSSENISVNASLPNGVYYVELSGANFKQVKQIVIAQ